MAVKAIMNGCNGRMGQVISSLAEKDPDIEIVAGVDVFDEGRNSYPVYTDINDFTGDADVIIDFSLPKGTDALLDYAEKTGTPVVLCTTGLSETQLDRVRQVSGKTAILRSANMSVGVNMLLKVLKDAAPALYEAGFDIEIVEKHHNQKKDAPSGTALALADAVNNSLNGNCEYVYDRSGREEKRPVNEIGISAVRGGSIPGDHDVIFAGEDEVVTFSHRAYSRAIFGKGAIAAAKFLKGKKSGMYDMSDVLG